MNSAAKRYGLLPEVYARMVSAAQPAAATVLTGGQARVARGLLGWSRPDLARKAGVPLATIQELEADKVTSKATLQRVRDALERASVTLPRGGQPQLKAR